MKTSSSGLKNPYLTENGEPKRSQPKDSDRSILPLGPALLRLQQRIELLLGTPPPTVRIKPQVHLPAPPNPRGKMRKGIARCASTTLGEF